MNPSILIVLGAVVLIILVIVGIRLSAKNETGPIVEDRLARIESVSLEDIELQQPFTERVVIPLLRKLGVNTKRLEAEKQDISEKTLLDSKKDLSLLKRIEQGQSETAEHLSTLQSRRVSAPAATPQTGSYFDLKARIQNKLLAEITPSIDLSKTDKVRRTIQSLFEKILAEENIVISHSARVRLFKQIAAEIFGFSISVSCPRLLSKKFESTFLIQLFLAIESAKVKSNVMVEFQNQEANQLVTKSELSKGDKIRVKLFHPDFLFSDTVTKRIEYSVNKIIVLGKPKDNCEPGFHKILVSISDADTEQELESFTFTVNVVDFAFGNISRPLVSRVSAVVLGLGSFAMFILTLLAQIDKTVGLTSGATAGVLTLAISANFYNLYQHVRPNTP